MKHKRIAFSIILMLCVSIILGGCGEKLPDGFENKTFLKDLDKIYHLMLQSMSNRIYDKDGINNILDRMNSEKYKNKLNNYELLFLDTLNEVAKKLEYDLEYAGVTESDTADVFLELFKKVREIKVK